MSLPRLSGFFFFFKSSLCTDGADADFDQSMHMTASCGKTK